MARRRQYKKAKATSKKVFSNKQKTVISKLAKKACAKEAETKFNQRVDDVYLSGSSVFKSWNLFSEFTQGTTDNQVLGNKLHWRGIKIHWMYEPFGGSERQWFSTPVTINLLLIETKHFDVNGVVLADVRDSTSSNPQLWFPNNETKILYKKRKTFCPIKTGDKPINTGSIWLKRNQVLTFKDLGSTKQLNKMNYYFVCYADENDVIDGEKSGQFRFAWKNYFKDA